MTWTSFVQGIDISRGVLKNKEDDTETLENGDGGSKELIADW